VSKNLAVTLAGHVTPECGRCFRFYSEEDYKKFPEFPESSLRLEDTRKIILNLISLGLTKEQQLRLPGLRNSKHFTTQLFKKFKQNSAELAELGLLHKGKGKLTAMGRLSSFAPFGLRVTRALVMGMKLNVADEVLSVVSLGVNPEVIAIAESEGVVGGGDRDRDEMAAFEPLI